MLHRKELSEDSANKFYVCLYKNHMVTATWEWVNYIILISGRTIPIYCLKNRPMSIPSEPRVMNIVVLSGVCSQCCATSEGCQDRRDKYIKCHTNPDQLLTSRFFFFIEYKISIAILLYQLVHTFLNVISPDRYDFVIIILLWMV